MVSTHAIPELTEGVRVCWEEDLQSFALLYPEGMIVLDGSTSAVLRHCDGTCTIEEIFAKMKHHEALDFDRKQVLKSITEIMDSGLLRLR